MIAAWDIETGPLPDDQLPPFDHDSVKLGNTKDPVKVEQKRREAEQAWREKLALDALTGQVLAIGIQEAPDDPGILTRGGEYSLIGQFWSLAMDYHKNDDLLVGFNTSRFDLPFLVRRSMILGIQVPSWVQTERRYWSRTFLDLMELWSCGDRQMYVKMDTLCKAFGVEGKPEGMDGGGFAGKFNGTAEERKQAISYLEDDLRMVLDLAERMRV